MKKIFNISILLIQYLIIIHFLSCEDPVENSESDSTPPQAVILFPSDGESVSGEIVIQARSIDNDIISHVEFFINQQIAHIDSSANENNIFTYRWNTAEQIGSGDSSISVYMEDHYQYISIVSYDLSGNNYATSPIRVKIDNFDNEPPEAFILNPFEGQTLSSTYDIIVIASDNDSIASVNFYVDERLEAVRPTPTLISEIDPFGNPFNYLGYLYTWNTSLADDGYHSIRITATDMNNNIKLVEPTGVIVDNGVLYDYVPPTGAIVSPPAGLTVNGTIPVIVNANDNIAMGEVAFSIDGTYLGTIYEIPYAFLWDTTQESEDEEHVISVVLIDSIGNETPLNPISVFVDNYQDPDTDPPSIMILYPSSGQTLAGNINIEATANDNSGVSHVVFYIDGDEIHLDDTSPFNYDWNTTLVEEDWDHTIAVVAYDNNGNSTLAPPITVFINNFDNIDPVGQIQSPIPGQTLDGTINIEVAATDNTEISHVLIAINGTTVDTIINTPYTYSWDTSLEIEDSYHVISGEVADTTNNLFYLSPIVVYVDNYFNDITPPTGAITYPISGQTVSGLVDFTVIAQDDYGINEVEFYINGLSIDIDNEYPYQVTWDTSGLPNDSQHTLSATVSDNSDHTILIQPILVTVYNE